MLKSFLFDAIFLVLLVFLTIFLVAPVDMTMPNTMHYGLLGVFSVLIVLFLTFVWRQSPKDEREAEHVRVSGRLAYLLGAAVLALGLVVESVQHRPDPWIPLALTVMMGSRIIILAYYSVFK